MTDDASYDRLAAAYADDKPFRMSEPPQGALVESQDVAGTLHTLSRRTHRFTCLRSRYFTGIGLAVPLLILLWILFF